MMRSLSGAALEFPLLEGAAASGIATLETLAGGPPSTDLTYVLPSARSAVCFAVPLDQEAIGPYLMKKDRRRFEKDCIRANVTASGIAAHLANYFKNLGYEAVPVEANLVFRPAADGSRSYSPLDEVYPPVAHRYLAARSGMGHLGRSGNFIMPHYGAAVILGTVVASAELEPTPPRPAEENYCDGCRLCLAGCAARFMDFDQDQSVTLGGIEFRYSRRRNFARCDLVCSGFTGLAPNGKWSTWSPGRFSIPEKTSDLAEAYERIVAVYPRRPPIPGGRMYYYLEAKLALTCGNCQLICAPALEKRKERFQWLSGAGVVVQNEDGSLEAVAPEEARRRLAAMPPERRALYEEV